MGYAIQHQIALSTITCCSCGVVFAMPDQLKNQLRQSGDWFFCPNGHRQHFAQTEADRLRALLEQANRRNTDLVDEVARVQREKKRIERRVNAGVCPCCNRTFVNLARHMVSKHQDAKP
ncbi:hypothetical protein G3N95_24125 [Paraburkholderia sp. Tr-20389]|uniref:hypothetical protein n=1 Tax=Paraburkholderia sp. Tr-20389 TaxID=2703903 RepID=UPI00197EC27C|nr:hypothetical protein [Paraburkholderia sp. Tr-20389]MBN3756051.1 hypothetical protein [Paraburkholderia sp. Tr-20389]